MMVDLLAGSISRPHNRDQQPSEPTYTKFGPIRRHLHLQDDVDDADDVVPGDRVQLPPSAKVGHGQVTHGGQVSEQSVGNSWRELC